MDSYFCSRSDFLCTSSMSLSLPKAHLIGWFVESLVYGAYFVVFVQCMQVLRRRSRSSDYLVGTAILLFILATAHLVDDTIRVMGAFTSNVGTPNYPFTHYPAVSTWRNIVRGAVYVTATVISDAFILCRSFIVWERSCLVVAIPFMLFLADIALGIFWVHAFVHDPTGDDFFTGPLAERLKIFYAITLSMNIMCTCLIAVKIWRIQRAVAPLLQGSRDETSRLVPIIVESCSVYSLFLATMIATDSKNSMTVFIFLDPMCSVIGVVFSSLIVRVGSGLSHGYTNITTSDTTGSRTQLTTHAGRQRALVELPFTPSSAGSIPGRGVPVALSQTVYRHVDGFPVEELEMEMENTVAEHEGFDVV